MRMYTVERKVGQQDSKDTDGWDVAEITRQQDGYGTRELQRRTIHT